MKWLESSGAPVGMFPNSIYEETIVALEAGDLVIAYTDGVVEATNQDGEEWGGQGLLKAAVCGAQGCPERRRSGHFNFPFYG